jgi:hypothetical protein
MKKSIGFIAGAIIIGALFSGCSDTKPDNSATDPSAVLGTWISVIPANPALSIPDTLTVTLDIRDSAKACQISVSKPDTQFLLKIVGTWSISTDTLVIHASSGLLVDTTAAPDTLKPLGADVLAIPITVPIKRNPDFGWPVTVKDLGVVVDAFPIPESMRTLVRNVILTLVKRA